MCDVFREPVKWITNHYTPFTSAHTEVNVVPRGGNCGNIGNKEVCSSNERYGGKNNKNDNTGQVGGAGGGNHYRTQGGGGDRKQQ